jgi:long-chain fatty acid transport protein
MGSLGVPAIGLAAGFAVNTKSASALGSGLAGTAAVAEDASVVYNNPANMLELEGDHLSIGFQGIVDNTAFKDRGSNVSGEKSESSSTLSYIPNVYYVQEISSDVRFGFGMYAPFGLDLKWDDDWIGRYQATNTQITAINLSPAVAFRASPALTLGVSLDVQYLSAELSQMIDYGTICAAAYGAPACTAMGMPPQQSDGRQTLKADDWAYSFSAGFAYKASDATRVGMVMHGATRHDINGDSEFENVPTAFAATFTDSSGRVLLHLPETVELSVAHQVSPALTLMADYTWTQWSRLDELRVDFDNSLPTSVTTYEWKDVGRYSLGMRYRIDERWLARAGFFYDTSPVPNGSIRTPRAPDVDRRVYTLGINHSLVETDSIDLAIGYVDLPQTGIDNTDRFNHHLTGTTDSDAFFASLQWNHRLR